MDKRAWPALCLAGATMVVISTGLHSQSEAGFVIVSGSATYLQRIAMPPEAMLVVRIEDVSRPDAPATMLAETRELFGERQVPIKFSLQIPNAAIDPRSSYAVRATIAVDGKLRFTTARSYAVLTRGAANNVDMVLEAVQPDAARADTPAPFGREKVTAGLTNTYWKLTELDAAKVVMATTQARETRITLGTGSRLTGFGGCNQLVGAYELDGSALRFKQMAGTQMACASPIMALEGKLLKVLGATTSYRIEGQVLTLLDGDRVLARFEAVALH